jgi:hypothetical protein
MINSRIIDFATQCPPGVESRPLLTRSISGPAFYHYEV